MHTGKSVHHTLLLYCEQSNKAKLRNSSITWCLVEHSTLFLLCALTDSQASAWLRRASFTCLWTWDNTEYKVLQCLKVSFSQWIVGGGVLCACCTLNSGGLLGRKYKVLKDQVELFSSSQAAGSRLAGFYKIAVFAVMFVLMTRMRFEQKCQNLLICHCRALREAHKDQIWCIKLCGCFTTQQISKVSISMCIKNYFRSFQIMRVFINTS